MEQKKEKQANSEETSDSPSANTRSKVSIDEQENEFSSPNLPSCTPKKGKPSFQPNRTPNRTPVSSGKDPGGSGKNERSRISEIRAACLKKKREEKSRAVTTVQQAIYDPDATAREAKYKTRGDTGLIMDNFMESHYNPWDKDHIERPERLTYIRNRLNQLRLTERCKQV